MSTEKTNHLIEPFVGKADLPEVKSTSNTPQSDLRVRDIGVILGKQLLTNDGLGELQEAEENRHAYYKHNDKWVPDLLNSIAIYSSDKTANMSQLFEAVRQLYGFNYSKNWSGMCVIHDDQSLKLDCFNSVWATWSVPKVKVPNGEKTGDFRSATWVGLGGGKSQDDVLQAGVNQNVNIDTGGKVEEHYQAWYVWDQGNGSTKPNYPNLPVNPGDLLHVHVQYDAKSDQGLVHFINYTQDKKFTEYVSKPNTTVSFKGDTAQWIMERPCIGSTGNYYKLADYGTMEFINVGGLTNNDTLISPDGGVLYIMAGDPSYNNILSEPVKVGTSVRITWIHPY